MATPESSWKIDPDALRRRSELIPDCSEIPMMPTSPVVLSFAIGENSKDIHRLARVTVYCETGTVAIARILHGAVRQTFRRNVTSLDVVERLLRDPPSLTSIESSLFVKSKDHETSPRTEAENERVAMAKSVGENLELINVAVAMLGDERDKLAQHMQNVAPLLAVVTPTSSSSCSSQHLDESASSTTEPQGMEFQFSLPSQPMKQVDKCLSDITSMGRLIKSVSTNGKGTVFLYGNGGVAFTPNIPRALHYKLSQLRKTSDRDCRPAYVSLGTRDRFFMTFHGGKYTMKGPKALDREIKQSDELPASVAFGISFDTYFVVFRDGSWSCRGKDIPKALQDKLDAREDRPDLVCVNLGPSGEWFLRARNGRLWWGGTSDEMDDSIQQLLDSGHYLNFLDFGEEGSYFISYD